MYECRDDLYKYHLGPRLEVNAEGWLMANGRRLAQLPHRQWVRVDLACGLGPQATGAYDLTLLGDVLALGEQLRLALEMWLSLCRDMLMLAHGMEDKVTNVDYLEDLRRVMDSLPPAEALRVVNRLIKALDELEANANLRLLLENVFLDLPQVS